MHYLCYYITGHGYGHAVRSAQIINALPRDLPLILRTTVPARFFEEELHGRDFHYDPAEFDCGCLQSDSVTVLPRATLDRYAEIAEANATRLPDEIAFLQNHDVRTVVTDIASFPLRAAEGAGIPGCAVANFTWHDIYQGYTETSADARLLSDMAAEYALATTAFLTPLATPTVAAPFSHVTDVPIVARHGLNLRELLAKHLGTSDRLALLYLGPWGLDIDWQALGQIDGWTFLTHDPPAVHSANVIALDRRDWPFADTAASVDTVISKAGYGTVTECIANDVPLIYVPRRAFAEYDALVAGMAPWNGGIPISDTEFRAGHWQKALQASQVQDRHPHAYTVDGAAVIAAALTKLLTA